MVATLQPQTSSDKHRLVEIDETRKITRKTKPTIYTLVRKELIPAYSTKMNFCNGLSLDTSNITSGTGTEISHRTKRKAKSCYNL